LAARCVNADPSTSTCYRAAVILDGLCEWLERRGYTAVDDFRGLLAVPVGVDESARERRDYVTALRRANSS
jgi:dihydroorotate dehydrogenase (fumarate)